MLECTSNNLLRDLIAALRGAHFLAYQTGMPRSLRAVLLALKPLATVLRGAIEHFYSPFGLVQNEFQGCSGA